MNDQEVFEGPYQEKGTQVSPIFPATQLPITSPEAMLERAEQFKKIQVQLRRAAISMTRQKDWQIFGETPRPTASAVDDIAGTFGLQMTPPVSEYEEHKDEKGTYYSYTFKTNVILPQFGVILPAMGTCSSRDKFFGTVKGEPKPLADVTKDNVKKKALTNMKVNAVIEACGMRGLTVDDLRTAGVDLSGQNRVQYRNGQEGGHAHEGRIDEDEASKEITKLAWWYSRKKGEGIDIMADHFQSKSRVEKGLPPLSFEEVSRWRTPKQIKWIHRVLKQLAEKYPDDQKRLEETGGGEEVPE